ncbi:hypothetical protein CFAM422_009113 [Trichoderma lentiforme]|uniref:Uncharacterized protein n=1 Tax=Trichoderma lentiforme TaxID=1567552 RepID=A0A9P4X8N7_9HYPO|nr:hypothetical protein CFAM422_009113 [Trichoderma lentiforme]
MLTTPFNGDDSALWDHRRCRVNQKYLAQDMRRQPVMLENTLAVLLRVAQCKMEMALDASRTGDSV